MRLMSKGEYVIVPKGTKFTGAGKLGWTKLLARFSDENVQRYNNSPSLRDGKMAATADSLFKFSWAVLLWLTFSDRGYI